MPYFTTIYRNNTWWHQAITVRWKCKWLVSLEINPLHLWPGCFLMQVGRCIYLFVCMCIHWCMHTRHHPHCRVRFRTAQLWMDYWKKIIGLFGHNQILLGCLRRSGSSDISSVDKTFVIVTGVFQLTFPVLEAASRGMQWCLHVP